MPKIVLIGPESTAKTTIAQRLSEDFSGVFIPEYSREYALDVGRELSLDDLMPIVHGQLRYEENIPEKRIIFLDSNILASKVYSRWYYDEVPTELENILPSRSYDLYLLCTPDIPWVADPARSMSKQSDREAIFELFKSTLIHHNAFFFIIDGNQEDRYEKAKSVLTTFLENPSQLY